MKLEDLEFQLVKELTQTSPAVARLAENEDVLARVMKAYRKRDANSVHRILEQMQLIKFCKLICRWLCTWEWIRICRVLCVEIPEKPFKIPELQRYGKALSQLAANEEAAKKLFDALEREDSATFKEITEEFKLHPFCSLICFWVCVLRCKQFCYLICPTVGPQAEIDPLEEFLTAAKTAEKLTSDENTFATMLKSYETSDIEAVNKVLEELQLYQLCPIICLWLCVIYCHQLCFRICEKFPRRVTMAEIRKLALNWIELSSNEDMLDSLIIAHREGDKQTFRSILKEFGLERFCFFICRWICACHCRIYCWFLCPPACEIVEPMGCVEEKEFQSPQIFRGIEIRGTATGTLCDHYTLEWRQAGAPSWRSDYIHYSGPNPAQGTCGVVNSTLGYLTTFPAVEEGPVEIRLRVHPKQGKVPSCSYTITFELALNRVWISRVEGVGVDTPPGVFDPNAQLADASGDVRSFGNRVHVWGTAWVGGCNLKKLKRYTLSYHPGFVTDPTLAGFVEFWQVDFTVNPYQEDYRNTTPVNERQLTSVWKAHVWCLFPPCPPNLPLIANYLDPLRWDTRFPRSHLVEPVMPAVPHPATWTSKELPLANCQSGKYTLRLSVEDTTGVIKHDLQQVWFDNKILGPAHAKITKIAGVKVCEVINLSQFAPAGISCRVPWDVELLGIAYDDYIEEGNATMPSDNFGGYRLYVKKDGAPNPGEPIPIPGSVGWPAGGPFVGTSRVGTPDPAGRCTNPDPPVVYPAEAEGILAVLDMRRFEADCNPAEPQLTLKRGECCDYVISLHVWDNSICPGLTNHRHEQWHTFPVRICNDLP
jgi:hypothetical protein